jgi:hypothetical protein
MKKAFTITELLVAVGLLAAVLAASTMIFHYAIEAQRTAMATAEIMRTMRAITDQLNMDFASLRKDGYLVLRSTNDSNDAIYFFSTGDFISWIDSDVRSNTARIYFGPAKNPKTDLLLDIKLLTPGASSPIPVDCCDANFMACQSNIVANFENPNRVLSIDRPDVNMAVDPNDARRLLAQNIGSMQIEWTYGWFNPASPTPDKIVWWGFNDIFSDDVGLQKPGGILVLPAEMATIASAIQENKTLVPPQYYIVRWNPTNQQYWPKALKFTFTLYDSKGILKTGRRFEHIVYIGR